jgi:hypothetical protein
VADHGVHRVRGAPIGARRHVGGGASGQPLDLPPCPPPGNTTAFHPDRRNSLARRGTTRHPTRASNIRLQAGRRCPRSAEVQLGSTLGNRSSRSRRRSPRNSRRCSSVDTGYRPFPHREDSTPCCNTWSAPPGRWRSPSCTSSWPRRRRSRSRRRRGQRRHRRRLGPRRGDHGGSRPVVSSTHRTGVHPRHPPPTTFSATAPCAVTAAQRLQTRL